MTWWVEPPLPTRRARSAGYTLLELLVVLGIVGVALGAVGLALSDGRGREQLATETDRLAEHYDLARAHANAHATVWSLRLSDRRYRWQQVPATAPAPKALTREYPLPSGMRLRFLPAEAGAEAALKVLPGDDSSAGRLILDRPDHSDQGSEWLDLAGHGPARRGGSTQ